LTTLKIAVFAPIPSASVMTAMNVNAGEFRSWRIAKRRSFIISCHLAERFVAPRAGLGFAEHQDYALSWLPAA
jgi:hypothetical protein